MNSTTFIQALQRAVGFTLPEGLSYDHVVNCSEQELVRGYGLTPKRAERILAVREAVVAFKLNADHNVRIAIRGGGDVYRRFAARMKVGVLEVEQVWAMVLDGKHRVISETMIHQGSINKSLFVPSCILKQAVRENGQAVVVVHNHPSGDPTPSPEDISVTHRLQRAGRLIGIDLLDHVVIGDPGFVSLRERGHFLTEEQLSAL